ncbi:CRAL-TRIO domain-containing protein [Pisolithus albus]|nr:CRAL-TRIO domain-containing protein [Pisolithus albus]
MPMVASKFMASDRHRYTKENDHRPKYGVRQQEDILEQFRRQVFQEDIVREGDSIGTDDLTLLRFLRARKFNLDEAKKMIKGAQQWRKTVAGVGIDELYNQLDIFDYPGREQVFRSWSMFFHKAHKMGRPLNIEFLRGCDLTELYKHITPEKHWETIVTTTETLARKIIPTASRAAGHDIGGVFIIVDLKGIRFWQVKSLVQASFQMSQDYYPETMAKLAIVNAPSSFTFIWSIVKPWLAKETAEKVDVLGSDYQGVLLQLVDAENLPTTLGGKCTCEHAGGCDLSGAGPWRDERLARSAQATKQSASSSFQSTSKHEGNLGTPVADGPSNVDPGTNTPADDTTP